MTAQNFTTPVGRIVYGSVSKPQTKDAEGKPLVIKNGPDAGKPTQRYAFGLAVAKGAETHWNQTPWGKLIWDTAVAAWPRGEYNAPAFAIKVKDGDSTIPNKRGKKPCEQEGHAKHWILSFSSSFPPSTYNANGSQAVAADSVKTGFFVQVAGSVRGNDSTQNPGLYLNVSMVALQWPGKEITSGPDATAVGFGQGVQRPAGALDTPAGGLPSTPAAPVAPPPAAPAAPLPPPVAVAPAPGFIAPPVAPAAPTPPPPPVAGPVWKGPTGTTQAQYAAAGWSDEQMRGAGLLA